MSFDWTGLGALGTGIGALGSMATSFLNYGLSSNNFDYQKALQDRIFAREDTSLQRRMADAKAAGLNPYSVINSGGASSGNVVKTESPEMHLNTNGLIDTVNSILDIKQRQEQTKSLQLENENKTKTGLILDADLSSKNWQNKILGNDFVASQIGVQDYFLNSLRQQAEFNYDFGTDWHYVKDSKGNYDYGYLHTDLDKSIYGKSGNPWYGRQNIYDLSDAINYGILSDYWNNWYKQDVADTYAIKSAQRQLLDKQNSWYNWNQGFDMVTGAIDAVSGLLFKNLDLGLKKAMNNSQINLNSSSAYRNYSQAYRNYYGK